MDNPVKNYWQMRLAEMKVALEANNFEAHIAEDGAQAARMVLEEILPATNAKSVSWADRRPLSPRGSIIPSGPIRDWRSLIHSTRLFHGRKSWSGADSHSW